MSALAPSVPPPSGSIPPAGSRSDPQRYKRPPRSPAPREPDDEPAEGERRDPDHPDPARRIDIEVTAG